MSKCKIEERKTGKVAGHYSSIWLASQDLYALGEDYKIILIEDENDKIKIGLDKR